jgi:YVTN family beta-propeller protein
MKRSGLIGIVCDRFFGCGAGRLIGALLAALAASCVAVSSAGAKEVIKTITVGSVPRAVSSDGTHVWVTDWGENTVSEIEASSGKVINTIKVGEKPYGVSSDGTHVWVTNLADGTVSEIEASSGKVINTIEVGESPFSVSSDGSHVWVTNEPKTVSEIEASSAKVINTIKVGKDPEGVSSDGTHVWVTNEGESTVSEIEAVAQAICTGSSGTIALSPGLTDTAVFQRVETKGTLTGCSGKAFTEAKYTATLTTDSKVSCSALSGPGVPAFGTVQYAWSPKTKGTTGTLSLPLTETADIAFSSELETGPNSPSTLSGTISENYINAGICGVPQGKRRVIKPVTKGTFTGSAVNFE